jgi:hypothetical protein
MENSPPGIQTIPFGDDPVGLLLLSMVGAKVFVSAPCTAVRIANESIKAPTLLITE